MALPLITSEQRYLISRGGSATDRIQVLAADFNPLVEVVNDLIDGTTSLTEVEVGNGTAAAPSMSFTSDTNTGIYRVGADNLGISTGGTLAVDVSTTAVTSALPVSNAAGTVSAPSVTFTSDLDTGLYRIGANNIGVAANGAKVLDVSTSGLAVTGSLSATTTFDVGTNQTFAKEVNHTVTVTTTTTDATAGGNLSIASGAGATTGAGGNIALTGGASGAGATGNGGTATVTGGAAASTNGNGGAASLVGGAGTGTGSGGNVLLTPGASSSTTVAPAVIASAGLVKKPTSATVASGATVTGKELVGGLIAATGATGNWQLPDTTAITTAIGTTPAGTNFEFVFNAQAMTATNTATLVVGAGMTVASTPAITGGGTLTVTQDTQVTGGFRIVFDTATTCKIYRIW